MQRRVVAVRRVADVPLLLLLQLLLYLLLPSLQVHRFDRSESKWDESDGRCGWRCRGTLTSYFGRRLGRAAAAAGSAGSARPCSDGSPCTPGTAAARPSGSIAAGSSGSGSAPVALVREKRLARAGRGGDLRSSYLDEADNLVLISRQHALVERVLGDDAAQRLL